MRTCKGCGYSGPKESFPKAHEINGVLYYRHVCKSCYGSIKKSYRGQVRDKYLQYKSTKKCERCGFSDPRALTFHHRSRDDKDFTVSEIGKSGKSFESILKEIEKCDVLCANCHSILHADER
jgi:hypothetical protein